MPLLPAQVGLIDVKTKHLLNKAGGHNNYNSHITARKLTFIRLSQTFELFALLYGRDCPLYFRHCPVLRKPRLSASELLITSGRPLKDRSPFSQLNDVYICKCTGCGKPPFWNSQAELTMTAVAYDSAVTPLCAHQKRASGHHRQQTVARLRRQPS